MNESVAESPGAGTHVGIALVSGALLMTELALTRIFSVTMFYHFAFLAISIALFGLSASGVMVYVARQRLKEVPTPQLLHTGSILHAATTLIALAFLVRIRVDLTFSFTNLLWLFLVYGVATLPFFTGGAVISVAFSRLTHRINTLYAVDLIGAAIGCFLLVPLLNVLGAPGVIIFASGLSAAAAMAFAAGGRDRRLGALVVGMTLVAGATHLGSWSPFEVEETKGHEKDKVLFAKWNSFSRIGVYERPHDDWSLSPKYRGSKPRSLLMDIDSSASTPILGTSGNIQEAQYLRHDLTSIAYNLVERPEGFEALVIGPGGGRDVLTALLFGAKAVEGVEINPIIVNDVMKGAFRKFSGELYFDPRVTIHLEDGRSFVRRSTEKYDVIQASLVDTWAATAAGAYTLTENSLYTTEAFGEYFDHLTPTGLLTMTRWVADGLRLVTLTQAALDARGLDASQHLAIVNHREVITFILKRSPFTPEDIQKLQGAADELGFRVVYVPGMPAVEPSKSFEDVRKVGMRLADYRELITTKDRAGFLANYPFDVTATTDDRPFFFHTMRFRDQLRVAFGESMLFSSGLGALLSLFGISLFLVLCFILGPLFIGKERPDRGWGPWLGYFACLGAGFMLLEVVLLQRFVLLLGQPVYSLTVTLFSLLLGTGIGSFVSRKVAAERVVRFGRAALLGAAALGVLSTFVVERLIDFAMPFPLSARIAVATSYLTPFGLLLGIGLPTGMRILDQSRKDIVSWAWGINGALSVIGATLAIFVAMNWGFTVTLILGSTVYVLAASLLRDGQPGKE